MALPLIPHEHIEPSFRELQAKAGTEKLRELCDYVEGTWVGDTCQWQPSEWSVYKQPIRTNNDVEGWHYRLNQSAQKGSLGLYLLTDLLYRDAQIVSRHVELVSAKKMKRIQKKKYVKLQTRIFELWKKYEKKEITVNHLLKACSHHYGPCTA